MRILTNAADLHSWRRSKVRAHTLVQRSAGVFVSFLLFPPTQSYTTPVLSRWEDCIHLLHLLAVGARSIILIISLLCSSLAVSSAHIYLPRILFVRFHLHQWFSFFFLELPTALWDSVQVPLPTVRFGELCYPSRKSPSVWPTSY